jgi:hypothetical protein
MGLLFAGKPPFSVQFSKIGKRVENGKYWKAYKICLLNVWDSTTLGAPARISAVEANDRLIIVQVLTKTGNLQILAK